MSASVYFKINVGRLSAVETVQFGRQFLAKLKDHETIKEPFPSYVTSLQQMGEKIDRLESAEHAAKNRDLALIAIKNNLCVDTKNDIRTLLQHVELASQGNIEVLRSFAIPLKTKKTKSVSRAIPGPPYLMVKNGTKKGSFLFYITRNGCKNSSTEIEVTTGDPTVEANWERGESKMLTQFEMGGYQSGTQYSFRARSISTGGTGPWSNYVTLICL